MNARKWIPALLIVLGTASVPAMAEVNVSIGIGLPPPPARVEVVPVTRVGYVWAPGYYQWEGRRHVWREGHYIAARPGHRWVADRWEQRHGRWHHEGGRWEREHERHDRHARWNR